MKSNKEQPEVFSPVFVEDKVEYVQTLSGQIIEVGHVESLNNDADYQSKGLSYVKGKGWGIWETPKN